MYCNECGAQRADLQDGVCPACRGGLPPAEAAPPSLSRDSLLDAIMLPFQGTDAVVRLGIGCLVSLLPIAGQIWLSGYALRWSRQLLLGEKRDLPVWDEWGATFVEGLWASLVLGMFTLVPGVCVTAFSLVHVLGSLQTIPGAGVDFWALLVSLTTSLLVGGLILLICSAPAPLALCHYARTGRLIESLHPSTWMTLIARAPGEFIGGWLALFIGAGAFAMALATVSVFPLLGPLAATIGFWLLGVVGLLSMHAVFARYYLRHAGLSASASKGPR